MWYTGIIKCYARDHKKNAFALVSIDEYVDYYNEQRPSYALGYETPNDYYRRYMSGELQREDTFESRFEDYPQKPL